MNKTPLISIIIPVFNRGHLIGETLNSVISQTYTNWECIIVDDGSLDDTIKIIHEFLKLDNRFKFYNRPKEKPKGANACRNYGFVQSKGEFINWLDSDDLLHKDFLKTKIGELIKNELIDFCACLNSTFIENPNEIVNIDRPAILQSKNYIEDYLLNGLYFFTSSPLWRKQFLENKKLFDEDLHRSQERDFHFRMLTHNVTYLYLEDILVFKRLEKGSISANASKSIVAQKSVFKYFDNVFNYLKQNKDIKSRDKLIEYVFYRQTTNYYNINQLCSGILQRFNILLSHGKYLKKYGKSLNSLKQHFAKMTIGFLIVLFTNKGYKYFYFPQYDYTKKNE